MSATRDTNGQWQIDPAELFRVYKPAPPKEPKNLTVGTGHEARESDKLAVELKASTQENAFLREFHERERRQLESTIDDLKTDRDHWRQQATALLTHKPEPPQAVTLPAVLPSQPEPAREEAPAVPGPDVGERVALWFVAAFLLLVAGLAVGHWLGWV
jgi:hypothetical protein